MARQYPRLGRVAEYIEGLRGDYYFIQSDLHNNQFVGRVPMDREEFERFLQIVDFEHCPRSELKSVTGETAERSWRQTDEEQQLHVILYDGSEIDVAGDMGYTYVYAHIEPRWERAPWRSLRGISDADSGVKRMKQLFDEYGLNYEPIRP